EMFFFYIIVIRSFDYNAMSELLQFVILYILSKPFIREQFFCCASFKIELHVS
ncbi:hypothetical protein L9F63_025789, partial [Diploptera punctata]